MGDPEIPYNNELQLTQSIIHNLASILQVIEIKSLIIWNQTNFKILATLVTNKIYHTWSHINKYTFNCYKSYITKHTHYCKLKIHYSYNKNIKILTLIGDPIQ